MRESLGSVFLYNIIIVFVLIIFAFLAATLAYSKAFRVNSRILTTIEKYEGYNSQSIEEINQILGTLGYRHEASRCGKRGNTDPVTASNEYDYCVYFHRIDKDHYSYGVTTYISMEFPLIRNFKLPVYTETERIFDFHA